MNCPVCKRPRPLTLWATGVWYDVNDVPNAVAYKCVCGNNRNIPWVEATREQREQAYLAEMSRNAVYGEITCR